jgi:hypothetical protein
MNFLVQFCTLSVGGTSKLLGAIPGSQSHSSSRSLSTGAENVRADKPAASKQVEKRMM